MDGDSHKTSSAKSKKRSGPCAAAATSKKIKNGSQKDADLAALHEVIGYDAMSLTDVHNRIQELCRKVPAIPENGFQLSKSITGELKSEDPPSECAKQQQGGSETGNSSDGGATTDWNGDTPRFLPRPAEPCRYDRKALRNWATALQTVLEEFYLLVALVSPATYRWGAERSGAAEQNLSLLSNEFVRSQEQITARVTTRLNDVLAPVVTLVTEKTITTKDKITDEEIKRNFFVTTYEDPDYVHLAYTILARNSSLLRQIVLANFDKLLRAISDYLNAQKKDSQHDARGLVY